MAVDQQSDALPVAETESDLIDLPAGGELSDNDARPISSAVPTRLVVVAGPAECGKTTLVTSVFELFQWAQIPHHIFGGSATLPGFERRCHEARIASARVIPETQRTRYEDEDVRYLHLRICDAANVSVAVDVLFTDVSGENFERARDSTDYCRELTFLHRAEHFVVLLDGEKLAEATRRWGVIQDAQLLLQSCLDSDMLGTGTFLDVVIAKCDFLMPTGTAADPIPFDTKIETEFRAMFGARVGRIEFSQIAARPLRSPALPFGYGVADLVHRWATSTPRQKPLQLERRPIEGVRESERFYRRHFGTTE